MVAVAEHHLCGHLGVSATITRILSKYWIIHIRILVKQIVSKCIVCCKRRKTLCSQSTGQLPIEIIQPSLPFSSKDFDFFGPYSIKGEVQKRIRGKCYGVIFVCMVSRAVYVDVSLNYSIDSLLQVLHRFTSVRGWPNKIFSDQGSQLVAASKELRDIIKGIDWNLLKRFSVNYNTEWDFAAADSPWINSATEALVKTVKRSLNTEVGEQVLSFVELQTVMFEAAQIVNQRPIGSHPSTPEDGTYLCPNDLILGRSSSHAPQGPFKET